MVAWRREKGDSAILSQNFCVLIRRLLPAQLPKPLSIRLLRIILSISISSLKVDDLGVEQLPKSCTFLEQPSTSCTRLEQLPMCCALGPHCQPSAELSFWNVDTGRGHKEINAIGVAGTCHPGIRNDSLTSYGNGAGICRDSLTPD